MQITDIHELILDAKPRGSYILWFWRCTCGAFSGSPERSKAVAEIGHHWHRYPDTPPPVHTMTPTLGQFGGPAWTCTCGAASRPEGFSDERRRDQTFHRHYTTVSLGWVRRHHDHQLARLRPETRKDRDALIQWHAKDSATRYAQTQYVLDQIL